MSASLIGSFILASILVVISPGPATLYVLRRCHGSLGEPIKAVAGIVAGDIVLITLSGVGVAALVIRFPEFASAMKLTGAGYIAWVGFNLLVRRASADHRPEIGLGSSLVGGLLITLSNPKAILFFAAFFPLFMNERAATGDQFLGLALIFEAVNLVFFALFILAARGMLRRSESYKTTAVRAISGFGLLVAATIAIAATLAELFR